MLSIPTLVIQSIRQIQKELIKSLITKSRTWQFFSLTFDVWASDFAKDFLFWIFPLSWDGLVLFLFQMLQFTTYQVVNQIWSFLIIGGMLGESFKFIHHSKYWLIKINCPKVLAIQIIAVSFALLRHLRISVLITNYNMKLCNFVSEPMIMVAVCKYLHGKEMWLCQYNCIPNIIHLPSEVPLFFNLT